jgi:hypothetical protein
MIQTIKILNGFDIDVLRQTSNQYAVVWPGGAIALLDRDSTKLLAAELTNAVRWEGRTVKEYQEGFFRLNPNRTLTTIY